MDYKKYDSFEKVLAANGETLDQFNDRTMGLASDTIGFEKTKAIAYAMNGGKHVASGYFPVFLNPNRSAAGFSCYGYLCVLDFSHVGARQLFENHNAAIFAGKTFLSEYSQFING